jgi:hypothetical protein
VSTGILKSRKKNCTSTHMAGLLGGFWFRSISNKLQFGAAEEKIEMCAVMFGVPDLHRKAPIELFCAGFSSVE